MENDFKPYAFRPSLALLRELKDSTPKEKLEWLEETNEFISRFCSLEDITRWKRLISRTRK